MRKTISLLLVLVMILSLSGGVTAFAEELGGVDQQLVEQVVEPTSGLEQSPEQNTENDPAQSPVEDPAENPEQDPAGDPENKPETETGTEPKSETETGKTNEETGEPTEPNETEETEESDTEEQSGEIELLTLVEENGELALDGAGETSTVSYDAVTAINGTQYVSIVIGGQVLKLSRGQMSAAAATISDGKLSAEKSMSLTVEAVEGADGVALKFEDKPNEYAYLCVTEGALAKAMNVAEANVADYAKWSYADGKLKYGNYYMVTPATVTSSENEAATVTLYGGNTIASGGGKGDKTETVDELAPVINTQPLGVSVTQSATGNAEFTVSAALSTKAPEGAVLTYQWTKNGANISTEENASAATATLTLAVPSDCGIAAYRCVVTYTDDQNAKHSTTSAPAALIVHAGTDGSDIVLFSDVHQQPENIADILSVYMSNHDGKLPGLVMATGDYHNGQEVVSDRATIKASLDAIAAMLGGESSPIKTLYLAGNHETRPYIVELNGDTGLIYGQNTGENVYVYTINYDEIQSYDYQNAQANIQAQLETALKGIYTYGDRTKPILIIAHAGIHTLENAEGGDKYNIDHSDAMVDMLNRYAKNLQIFYFFGHDHSKGEEEFYKTAGDTTSIISTYDYDGTTAYNREISLNFTYGHMGYLTNSIGGSEKATIMNIGENGITLQRVGKSGYVDASFPATAPGEKDVPVVKALEKRYDPGTTLRAEVEGEGEYTYQWYEASDLSLATEDMTRTEIANATGESFKPDKDGYYFCKVTCADDTNSFATTTVTHIGVATEEEAFPAGEYAIVLKEGNKSYVLLSDEGGALSIKEVELRDNKVVGPATDFYVWDFASPDKGSVVNEGAKRYLTRTSAQDGGTPALATTQDSNDKYVGTWVYDDTLHNLYNASAGGSTTYYYPEVKNGELTLTSASTLGEANIYLMKLTGGEPATPNTDPRAPATADNGSAGFWAALALTASAAMIGAVVLKKKTEA